MTKTDIARAADRLGISEEIYNELYVDFLVMVKEKADLLEKAISSVNIAEARKVAHTIKGSAANLGVGDVADITRTIEGLSSKGMMTEGIVAEMKKLSEWIRVSSS